MSQNSSSLLHDRLQRLEAENQRLKRLEVENQQRLKRTLAENQQLNARLRLSTSRNEPELGSSAGEFQLCTAPAARSNRYGAVPRGGPGIIVPTTAQRRPNRSQESSQPLKRAKTVHVTKPLQGQAAPPSSSITNMARSKSTTSNLDSKSGSYMSPRPEPMPSLSAPPSRTGHVVPVWPNCMSANFIHGGPTGQETSLLVFGGSLANKYGPRAPPPPMSPLAESGGRVYNPDEYLSLHSQPFDMPPDMEPSASIPIAISWPALDGAPAFPDQDYSQSGLPSACGSLTSGPTLDTSMSRQNSQAYQDNLSLAGNLDMMRMHSQQSAPGHGRHGSYSHHQLLSPESMFPKDHNELMQMGANLTDPHFPSSAPPTHHYAPMVKSQSQSSMLSTCSVGDWEGVRNETFASTDMQRTESNQSNKSLKLRAKEALQRQNANAAIRNIQPKPLLSSLKKGGEPPSSSTQAQSAAAAAAKAGGKEGKAAIAKTTYQRPKHPKVYCPQCPEDKEGFRGEHELRRHAEAKHKTVVRKYICVEPDVSASDPPLPVKVFKSLKDCKQCSAGKQYGAYYNAAAHLRRTHFKQKTSRAKQNNSGSSKNVKDGGGNTSSSKSKGTASAGEGLGGKGGGDWPPMNVLKLWMKAINVSVTDPSAYAEDSMDACELAELDDMAEYDPQVADAMAAVQAQAQAQAMAGAATSGGAYDMYVAGVGAGFTGLDRGLDMNASLSLVNDDGTTFQRPDQDFLGQWSDPVDPAMFLSLQGAGGGYDFGGLSMPGGGHHHLITDGLPSGNGADYNSPVSSTGTAATITPTVNKNNAPNAVFQLAMPSSIQADGGGVADMSFEMAFPELPHGQ